MRRAIGGIVVLVLVGAATLGLGYLLGRRAAPGPLATPSASPTTVLVPKVLHLSLSGAVQQVLSAELAIGKVETRTGGERGTIVAQFPPPGASAPPGSPVNLFVSTSLYPKGAFEQCPIAAGTLALGPGSVHQAERAALRFAKAFLLGDWRTVRGLLDPSALPLRKDHWAIAGKREHGLPHPAPLGPVQAFQLATRPRVHTHVRPSPHIGTEQRGILTGPRMGIPQP